MVAEGLARPVAGSPEDSVKWLADENFRNAILRGILRRIPGFNVLRVQDLPEISSVSDPALLEWATRNQRVLTHDLSTMIPAIRSHKMRFADTRVVLVPDSVSTGQAIEDILLLDECAVEGDWAAGVIYLPLR